jgi:poly-gamma-glutamate synthesis protein (capsule biosynthesis protein)
VLTAARIAAVSLANNHVLDWGPAGLAETIETLERAGIKHSGAGKDTAEAAAPAVMDLGPKGRVLLFSLAHGSSGVPSAWAAGQDKAGVALLPDLSGAAVRRIREQVRRMKRPGDVVVLSVHWGSNWGYGVSEEQVRFSRRLIDEAGVDVIHGHSSHHPRPIEVYRRKLILYGCGDLLNDYEGITGHESYRPDLALLYHARIDPAAGALVGLEMTPLRVKRFRLNRASRSDAEWLAEMLSREGKAFGAGIEVTPEGRLKLRWKEE